MSSLFFRYGQMNASKSLEVLRIAYNYEETGRKCLLMKSATDTRYGVNYVASRVGLKREAIPIRKEDEVYDLIANYMRQNNIDTIFEFSCIVVDESQFLTEEHVSTLRDIVSYYGVPVICYGLRTDFQNNWFEGSSALMRQADKIEEVKTVCVLCSKKATNVLRIENGLPVYHGEQVKVGGNESYLSVCYNCYKNPDLSKF